MPTPKRDTLLLHLSRITCHYWTFARCAVPTPLLHRRWHVHVMQRATPKVIREARATPLHVVPCGAYTFARTSPKVIREAKPLHVVPCLCPLGQRATPMRHVHERAKVKYVHVIRDARATPLLHRRWHVHVIREAKVKMSKTRSKVSQSTRGTQKHARNGVELFQIDYKNREWASLSLLLLFVPPF